MPSLARAAGSRRARQAAAAGSLVALAVLGYVLANRPRANPGDESARPVARTLPPASTDRAAAEPLRERIESLGSSCHLLPSADLEPKAPCLTILENGLLGRVAPGRP